MMMITSPKINYIKAYRREGGKEGKLEGIYDLRVVVFVRLLGFAISLFGAGSTATVSRLVVDINGQAPSVLATLYR
jgi:hypothetical protein